MTYWNTMFPYINKKNDIHVNFILTKIINHDHIMNKLTNLAIFSTKSSHIFIIVEDFLNFICLNYQQLLWVYVLILYNKIFIHFDNDNIITSIDNQ